MTVSREELDEARVWWVVYREKPGTELTTKEMTKRVNAMSDAECVKAVNMYRKMKARLDA